MGVITYTAKRDIASGHAAGNSYALEIQFQEYTPDHQKKESTQETLDFSRETIILAWRKMYLVTIGPVTGSNLDIVREFIASVLFYETFDIDLLGTAATPNNPITVQLKEGAIPQQTREQDGPYFSVSFQVVAV